MKILFDQGTPAPLRKYLGSHEVVTVFELRWSELSNGSLLAAAEPKFDVFVTTDQNLRYQQNIAGRKLAIVVLSTTNWPRIKRHVSLVTEAINQLAPSGFVEVSIPE